VGGFAMGDIAGTSTGDIMKQYKLNFETAYNMVRPIFIEMKKQNTGRIFLVGSRPGLDATSGKGMIAYGLAKSLVFRLAELMNEEGKAHNIVTSVIIPGTIDTPQNRLAMPDADFSKWVSAEEIANTISFFCSEGARSIREPLIKMYGNS
jgi:NAD(P)-dependent dehydrogenase (short-subunit alcohol dehydrogenase family)